jgi:hypothetical protein
MLLLNESSECISSSKKWKKDRAKMEIAGGRGRNEGRATRVLVPNKFQYYSLTEEQVDLVFCTRFWEEGEGGKSSQ